MKSSRGDMRCTGTWLSGEETSLRRATEKPYNEMLEIQSLTDNAWYEGEVSWSGHKLRVHFKGYDEGDDEEIAGKEQIKKRVRYPSVQLQDHDCGDVQENQLVSALFECKKFDKYFNCKVLHVVKQKHTWKGNLTVCKCLFRVVWMDGPEKERTSVLRCSHICLLSNDDITQHPLFMHVFNGDTAPAGVAAAAHPAPIACLQDADTGDVPAVVQTLPGQQRPDPPPAFQHSKPANLSRKVTQADDEGMLRNSKKLRMAGASERKTGKEGAEKVSSMAERPLDASRKAGEEVREAEALPEKMSRTGRKLVRSLKLVEAENAGEAMAAAEKRRGRKLKAAKERRTERGAAMKQKTVQGIKRKNKTASSERTRIRKTAAGVSDGFQKAETPAGTQDTDSKEPWWEVRASDGAWYAARLSAAQSGVQVIYEDGEEDLIQSAAELRQRVRHISPPLDFEECHGVAEGSQLCATLRTDQFVKYFDCVVLRVIRLKHGKGEEDGDLCPCQFVVRWLDGPRKDKKARLASSDLCTHSPQDCSAHGSFKFLLTSLHGLAAEFPLTGMDYEEALTLGMMKLTLEEPSIWDGDVDNGGGVWEAKTEGGSWDLARLSVVDTCVALSFFSTEGKVVLEGRASMESRIRPLSKRIDDWACADVDIGSVVCARCPTKKRLFFDCRVVQVKRSQHVGRICSCEFVVEWMDGPLKRKGGTVRLASLYSISPETVRSSQFFKRLPTEAANGCPPISVDRAGKAPMADPDQLWEAKSVEDDAWRPASLSIRGPCVFVKFAGKELEERLEAMEDLLQSVRLRSAQLQDDSCGSVCHGQKVSALHLKEGLMRFFDCRIREVGRKEHHVVEHFGQSFGVCNCKFDVQWVEGPDAGKVTSMGCHSIRVHSREDIWLCGFFGPFVGLLKEEQSIRNVTFLTQGTDESSDVDIL